ncbi:MAG: hypothetical protein ACI85Z_000713 [Rheinheimera aquimaris]|jgi:hypothetical protein
MFHDNLELNIDIFYPQAKDGYERKRSNCNSN